MNIKSIGLIVVSCGLALIFYGCGTGGHSVSMGAGTTSQSGNNQYCTWTFDRGPSGKVVAGTLRASLKAGVKADTVCKVQEGKRFNMQDPDNDWTAGVSDANTAEFSTLKDLRGLCRYCYVNGAGGVSCVVYPC